MATIVRVEMQSSLTPPGGFEQPMPSVQHTFTANEGQTSAQTLVATGASAAALPGIGAGAGDITTLEYFYVLAYGTITLGFMSGVFPLIGTTTRPAALLFSGISTTSVPTVTNSSGDTVRISYQFAGS